MHTTLSGDGKRHQTGPLHGDRLAHFMVRLHGSSRCARTAGCSSPRTASFGAKSCCIIAMCDAQCVVSRGAMLQISLATHHDTDSKNPCM